MSTNYYIKGYDTPEINENSPKWHLGKRYSAGNGKLGFIWAIDMTVVEFAERIEELELFADSCIVNEYGEEFSVLEFMNLALGCDVQDTDSIGKEFC